MCVRTDGIPATLTLAASRSIGPVKRKRLRASTTREDEETMFFALALGPARSRGD
jgi:hypothetical protein